VEKSGAAGFFSATFYGLRYFSVCSSAYFRKLCQKSGKPCTVTLVGKHELQYRIINFIAVPEFNLTYIMLLVDKYMYVDPRKKVQDG
jgi:hypothetical protein